MSENQPNTINKLNRILSYLNSFTVESFKAGTERSKKSVEIELKTISPASREDRPADQNVNNSKESPSQDLVLPNSIKKYYTNSYSASDISLSSLEGRLNTFRSCSWGLSSCNISVYDFVKRGWYKYNDLVMKCSHCEEFLSIQLPEDVTSAGYSHALGLLKERIISRHQKWCKFASAPALESLCKPPSVLSPSHIYVLSEAAHVLADKFGEAVLPHINLPLMLEKLKFDEKELTEIWGDACNDFAKTALALVMFGWKKSSASDVLSCNLCKRDVAIKFFKSFSDGSASTDANTNEKASPEEDVIEERGEKKDGKETVAEDEINENNKRPRSESEEENQDEISRSSKKAKSDIVESSKRTFCPLSQHHFWCAWVNTTEKDSDAKGYEIMSLQVKSAIQLAQKRNWISSPKYSTNIEGMRTLRSMLSSWTRK